MVIAPTTILMFVGLVGAAALVALALYRKFILHGSAKRPLVGAVLAAAVFVASAGAIQINAGYVGVVRYFGAAAPGELQPGLHFVMPLVTTVEMVDTRVQALPFDNLEGASKEYQPIMLTGVLNITVVPDRADELVQRVGTDWAAKIVFPAYANIVKEVLPQYGIAEILPRRDEIRTQTIARLKENIEARYGLTVNDIYLSNITFTQAYIDAIVAKQVAEQETLRQAQLVQAETQKARQAEVIAMGQAAAAIAIAQGEARANALIAESLTAEVLQSRYIDKLADDVRVIIVPSDGGNFLWNMADLTGGQGAKPSPSASPAPSPVAPAPSPVAPAPTPVAPPANQPGNHPESQPRRRRRASTRHEAARAGPPLPYPHEVSSSMAQTPISYGGQALVEGVMIRGRRSWSVAIRHPAGDIVTRTGSFAPAVGWRRLPVLRGIWLLGSQLRLGWACLSLSARVATYGDDRAVPRASTVVSWLIALAIGLGLFVVAPMIATGREADAGLGIRLAEGALKFALLLGYLALVGRMPRVSTVFAYHGAEHMAVHAHEAGRPLSVAEAAAFDPAHPRCGTAFLVILALADTLILAALPRFGTAPDLALRIFGLPLLAGFAYELLRLGARRPATVGLLNRLGIATQRLTTRRPSEAQLEVALAAMQACILAEGEQLPAGSQPIQTRPIPSVSETVAADATAALPARPS